MRRARLDDDKVLVPRIRRGEGALAARLRQIREELELPESFAPEVEADAREAAQAHREPALDLEHVPFVTIDPPTSTDLDQALQIERSGEGYTVRYAIADVPAFVAPGGAIDEAARARGQTLYAPDGRIPLHPTTISEDAASLLPERVRSAYVWTFALDSAAAVTSTTLERARVRSRRRYSYEEAQGMLDSGTADESLTLLREVGTLRVALEQARGGASLNRPDEEVTVADGRYTLTRRAPHPVENWNAQLSLMTGMAAARIMIDGRIGILRTMPAPSPETLETFRRQVAALGCPWPDGQPYGEFLRSLDHSDPAGLAATHAAASLFRGAGYPTFDGDLPHEVIQAAVAAPYAHTTAPIRRLVDRFVLVTCEALLSGRPVADWVREALPTLPGLMSRSSGVASRLENLSVDAIEAALLSTRVGEVFEAVVIAAHDGVAKVQLEEPLVTAAVESPAAPGESIRIRLISADITTGTVEFRPEVTE